MDDSFLSPSAALRHADGAVVGIFAVEPIAAGQTVVAFGGVVMTRDQVEERARTGGLSAIQIDERLYLVSAEAGPADQVNHSCQPNTGLVGTNLLVALRDIMPGEELTFDYAMTDGSDYDEFECHCGSPACRGKVTGHDWMLPELQRRYRGHFSPYIARRIAELAAASTGAGRRAFSY